MTCTLFSFLIFFILICPCCNHQLNAQENILLEESIEELLEGNNLDEQALESLAEVLLENDSLGRNKSYKQKTGFNLISTSWGAFENDGNGFCFSDTLHVGPPVGARLRGRITGSGYTIKAIMESDPGEAGLNRPDHISSGIDIHPKGQKFRIIIGDYHARQGLGLGFSTRPVFSSWKTDPHLVLRSSSGISLHGSSDESSFLRGGALEGNLGKLTTRAFLSARQLDAVIRIDDHGQEYFSSVYKTGYHRTGSEVDKKDVLREEISGVQLQYSGGRFEAAGLFSHFIFSRKFPFPLKYMWPPGDQVYVHDASRYALYARMLLGNGMIQAEYAGSSTGGTAMLIGYSGFFNKGLSYLLAFENSQKGFFTHNTAVSSSLLRSSDKTSGRLNIMYRPRKRIGIQTDICLEGISDPLENTVKEGYSIRSRFIADLEFAEGEAIVQSLNGKITGSLRIKEADTDKNFFWQGEMGISSSGLKNLITVPGTYFSFRSRYKTSSGKLHLQAGISIFSKRIDSPVFYTYEPDVLYGMSIPALSGTGTRTFFVLKYKVLEGLRLEGKVWRLERFDTGVKKLGWKVQLVYNY